MCEGTIAADEESITQEKTERGTNQDTLDSTLTFLKELAPGSAHRLSSS